MDTMLEKMLPSSMSLLLCIFSSGSPWLDPPLLYFPLWFFFWGGGCLSLTKHPPLEINRKVTRAHTWDQYLAAGHYMKERMKQWVPLTMLMVVMSPYQCPGKGERNQGSLWDGLEHKQRSLCAFPEQKSHCPMECGWQGWKGFLRILPFRAPTC